MILTTKKISRTVWSMELQYDHDEQDLSLHQYLNPHDARIALLCQELAEWGGDQFNRMSYSAWHWHDAAEMDRFVTYFMLKHGDQ